MATKNRWRRVTAALFALAAIAGPTAADPGEVNTSAGPVVGEKVGGVWSFKGVPYAKPPVGELRWRTPQPPVQWTQPRRADAYGPDCPQPASKLSADRRETKRRQSEDCLYLNVWTQDLDRSAKRPVMVWIHGGGFVQGSGAKSYYDGSALAKRGAVVVTFNYRLGPLGFFVHPDLAKESADGAAGNYGLMDQIAALRWVRENIAAFGGNPGNVTVFGESAGAVSVLLLMTAQPAQGLFHRAIAQSGSVMEVTTSAHAAQAQWRRCAAQAGIDYGQDIAALRTIPADNLLKMGLTVGGMPGKSARRLVCQDGAVLDRNPGDVFRAGQQAKVPLLVTSNADEGTLFAAMDAPMTAAAYRRRVRAMFPSHADAILRLYPAESDSDAKSAWADALGDATFTNSARNAARWQAATRAPTWRAFFCQAMPAARRIGLGATHGGEIPYVFDTIPRRRSQRVDRNLSGAMADAWVAFARTGKPAAKGLPAWDSYDPKRDNAMVLDARCEMREGIRTEKCDLWDAIRQR